MIVQMTKMIAAGIRMPTKEDQHSHTFYEEGDVKAWESCHRKREDVKSNVQKGDMYNAFIEVAERSCLGDVSDTNDKRFVFPAPRQ